MTNSAHSETWPALPLDKWSDTFATLHMWTQIVGKIRLTQTPWINHSWHVTLYVTARGLSTSPISCGERTFEIAFDFQAQQLVIQTSDGGQGGFPLEPQTVAEFYRKIFAELARLGIEIEIHKVPSELAEAIPFDENEVNKSYDREYANRFWRILVQCDRVFRIFRARYSGKCSPVHFFWGAGDLAVTRFSGRTAPQHPGGIPNLPDWVTREAYSHEVSSCGFWPGGGVIDYPAFYSYAYPPPPGFSTAKVLPKEAVYNETLGEFLLAYDAVREADTPDEVLLSFLQSTYEAAANLGKWDRAALEQPPLEKS